MTTIRQRATRVRQIFSSPRTIVEAIRIEKEESDEDAGLFTSWSNKDLDPSPPWQRTWTPWSFFAFQFSIAFSPTTYNVGASLFAVGLSWWIILISSFIVSFMVAAMLWLNARGASRYHVGYPVFVRMSAGIYGSLIFVFVRGVVAVLYMSIQTLYASYFVNVMLRCIFGYKWTQIPNHLPPAAGITSAELTSFLILWLLQFPFAFVHPSKMTMVFKAKSVLAPIGLIGTMIWALVTSHGTDFNGLGKADASGAALGWSFILSINTIISNVIPPLVNIPDLARYAKRPRDTLPLPIGIILSKPVVVLFGMIITSAGYKQFGEAYWNMWDFYSGVLDKYWGPGTRTVVFLAAGIQAFATFVTNITSNSIPVGCDLAGLFPRYFTIIRGQIVCFLLAWACAPWKLTYSASSFLTFLGSYLCFICPIVSVMIVDYWICRRGNIHVPSLYNPNPGAPYFYTHGFNIRAFVAWAAGITLVIPGVSGALKPGSIGIAAVHIYDMGFLLSTTFSGLLYYICCKIWPLQVYPLEVGPKDDSWEVMKYMEGFFPEDEIVPEYLQGTVVEGRSMKPKNDSEAGEFGLEK
ncbi:Permease cytosine/purine uracil thiamine allantoin [Penicillium lagena]|uniref:Permease cytosine/purine uracil thiamine allantoin n=1 Tax=Penicillium lagena TaxID=94218 RepID=UPI0025400317|nr:Permease cytosine/purine uracil thiamine allantoin [Penicillium lagena]KAJ5605509.1 Permease cytosine/purine uracil thiamine allantoin [Penicillium lagena]